MTSKKSKLLIMKALPILLFVSCLAIPAHAQSFFGDLRGSTGDTASKAERLLKDKKGGSQVVNQYDRKYKPMGNLFFAKNARDILPKGEYALDFVRLPNTPEDHATLRFWQNVRVSGCVKISPTNVEQHKRGSDMWVLTSAPESIIDTSKSHPTFECDQRGEIPSTDILLNREDITSGRMKTLTLKNATTQHEYNITADEHSITLSTKDGEEITHYTDYPDNLVILYGMDTTTKSETALESFNESLLSMASEHGMFPAEEKMPEIELPALSGNAHYFIDPDKKLSNILSPEAAPQFVDRITVLEKFLGSDGEYFVPRTIDIFARKPYMYE